MGMQSWGRLAGGRSDSYNRIVKLCTLMFFFSVCSLSAQGLIGFVRFPDAFATHPLLNRFDSELGLLRNGREPGPEDMEAIERILEKHRQDEALEIRKIQMECRASSQNIQDQKKALWKEPTQSVLQELANLAQRQGRERLLCIHRQLGSLKSLQNAKQKALSPWYLSLSETREIMEQIRQEAFKVLEPVMKRENLVVTYITSWPSLGEKLNWKPDSGDIRLAQLHLNTDLHEPAKEILADALKVSPTAGLPEVFPLPLELDSFLLSGFSQRYGGRP